MEKLIEIIKELLKDQPALVLSGSIALKLHGIKIRREPEDIDIFLPRGTFIPNIDGMTFIENSETYPESDFQRTSYSYKDVRIDFFIPERYKDYNPEYSEVYGDINNPDEPFSGTKALPVREIMAFKIDHALDYKYDGSKHAEDIIYILQNNGRKANSETELF